jgi:tripartite-type tricarboxylate transporter receptor subunit TctC
VPSALDLVPDAGNRQVLELILIRQEAGRPFAAPPGTPADRVAALRQAFQDTLADPDFVAEAAKAQLEIEPMSGDEIEKMLIKAYAAPKTIVERAAELVYPAAPKAQ